MLTDRTGQVWGLTITTKNAAELRRMTYVVLRTGELLHEVLVLEVAGSFAEVFQPGEVTTMGEPAGFWEASHMLERLS